MRDFAQCTSGRPVGGRLGQAAGRRAGHASEFVPVTPANWRGPMCAAPTATCCRRATAPTDLLPARAAGATAMAAGLAPDAAARAVRGPGTIDACAAHRSAMQRRARPGCLYYAGSITTTPATQPRLACRMRTAGSCWSGIGRRLTCPLRCTAQATRAGRLARSQAPAPPAACRGCRRSRRCSCRGCDRPGVPPPTTCRTSVVDVGGDPRLAPIGASASAASQPRPPLWQNDRSACSRLQGSCAFMVPSFMVLLRGSNTARMRSPAAARIELAAQAIERGADRGRVVREIVVDRDRRSTVPRTSMRRLTLRKLAQRRAPPRSGATPTCWAAAMAASALSWLCTPGQRPIRRGRPRGRCSQHLEGVGLALAPRSRSPPRRSCAPRSSSPVQHARAGFLPGR